MERSFTVSSDGNAHWRVYADNGETTAREEHLYVWHETRAASAAEDGEETGVCAVCGHTVTRALPYAGETSASATRWGSTVCPISSCF